MGLTVKCLLADLFGIVFMDYLWCITYITSVIISVNTTQQH